MRKLFLIVGIVALSLGLSVGVWARFTGRIVGTPRADVLKGTPRADTIDGRAGNDRLSGLAGNDVLIGGAGGDKLIGGRGADRLRCGAGKDTAVADATDAVGSDCEVVQGLPTTEPPPPPAPPPPPPPPPPPTAQLARAGHYCGFTNQGKSICFDVTADSSRVANFATTSDVTCPGAGEATFDLTFGALTPIQPDLTFAFTYNGPISSGDPDLTNIRANYAVTGKLDTVGNGTGTLTLSQFSFDYQGTHYDCGAAPYAWQAKVGA